MNYMDLHTFGEYKEKHGDFLDNEIAGQVLNEYIQRASSNLLYWKDTNRVNLMHQYALLAEVKKKQILDTLLKEYHFYYSTSFLEAIYFLLGEKREIASIRTLQNNPLLYPGILEISSVKNLYTIKTILGELKVRKANKVFKKDITFHSKLQGYCFERTLEFMHGHPDYQAVLAFVPGYFAYGYYHAYLERDGVVLDIAANALYEDVFSSELIYIGDIIKKCSYEEVSELFCKVRQEYPDVLKQNDSLLYSLALYYDYQKSGQKIL